MPAISNVPKEYDYEWIAQQANTTIHGVSNGEVYNAIYYEDSGFVQFNAFVDIVSNYKTLYLEKAVPEITSQIVTIRKEKVTQFSHSGITMNLDYVTESRLTSAAFYLQNNPDVLEVNWDVGEGEFLTLQRQTVLDLANAAASYVQECFNYSKILVETVSSCIDIDELNEIDITIGWP